MNQQTAAGAVILVCVAGIVLLVGCLLDHIETGAVALGMLGVTSVAFREQEAS